VKLPVRILSEPPSEPVISVDGAFQAPGLNLSHWPGNSTPADLAHELSTGSALLYAGLAQDERARRAGDARAIVNNHYDTDGVLAIFAVRNPRAALEHAPALLAAAAAGDFYRWPDDRALALDLLVTHLGRPGDSPLGAEIEPLSGRDLHERLTHFLLEQLPSVLCARELPWPELWRAPLEDLRADRVDLADAHRAELPELDLTLWTAAPRARCSRAHLPAAGLDPGRHALFGESEADRVLVMTPSEQGVRCRLVISTRSWFDLPIPARLPRPDLTVLAARLNELGGTAPEQELAWRAQAPTNASPELWFGTRELQSFAEHNPALGSCSLAPDLIRTEICAALSAS